MSVTDILLLQQVLYAPTQESPTVKTCPPSIDGTIPIGSQSAIVEIRIYLATACNTDYEIRFYNQRLRYNVFSQEFFGRSFFIIQYGQSCNTPKKESQWKGKHFNKYINQPCFYGPLYALCRVVGRALWWEKIRPADVEFVSVDARFRLGLS